MWKYLKTYTKNLSIEIADWIPWAESLKGYTQILPNVQKPPAVQVNPISDSIPNFMNSKYQSYVTYALSDLDKALKYNFSVERVFWIWTQKEYEMSFFAIDLALLNWLYFHP